MSARSRKHQVYGMALFRMAEDERYRDHWDSAFEDAYRYWEALIRELEDGTYGTPLYDWWRAQ